jgi:hypothetical protein
MRSKGSQQGEALAQMVLDEMQRFPIGKPGQFVLAVRGVYARRPDEAGEDDSPADKINALPAVDREGNVKLRGFQTAAIQLPALRWPRGNSRSALYLPVNRAYSLAGKALATASSQAMLE